MTGRSLASRALVKLCQIRLQQRDQRDERDDEQRRRQQNPGQARLRLDQLAVDLRDRHRRASEPEFRP